MTTNRSVVRRGIVSSAVNVGSKWKQRLLSMLCCVLYVNEPTAEQKKISSSFLEEKCETDPKLFMRTMLNILEKNPRTEV
jgi:hypothetical protein